MRVRLAAVIVAIAMLSLAMPPASYAFDWSKAFGGLGEQEQFHTFKLIHVKDLKNLIDNHTPNLHIYDANAPETRDKYGVIPGAQLIAAPDGYRVSTTLPAQKSDPLVFYCANQVCIASHEAARRALAAGYTNVSVMSDGIMGWKAAGEPTVSAAAASATSKSG
jgi:rhodanese-related sulfurtransferase